MGWTGIYTSRPAKEIITKQLTFTNESGTDRVVAICCKPGVAYIAWERSYAAGQGSMYDRKVFTIGTVVLYHRSQGEFTYKTITEDMGPCEKECPASILGRLSPVEEFAKSGTSSHEWATAWRNDCRKAIDRRAKAPGDGATIRFKQPITFTNGDTVSAFTIHKQGRKIRFSVAGDGYAAYQISGWQQREYEVL